MIAVGLTGGIGSGKSTIADIFRSLGVPIFESDKAGKIALQQPAVQRQILEVFGNDVFDLAGNIERKKLAAVVFNNKNQLAALNGIIHPAVRTLFEQWKKQCNAHGYPYVINESAILFESGLNQLVDFSITVSAPEDVRIGRVTQRDGISEQDVLSRIRNQISDYYREKHANITIVNDGATAIIPQVLKAHKTIINI